MQLISTNIAGNLHEASIAINAMGLAEFVVVMNFSGSNTVVVFKAPDSIAPEIRKYFRVLPEYIENPKPHREWSNA